MIGHDGITLGSSVAAWILFFLFTAAFVGFRSAAERSALFGLTLGAYVLKTVLAFLYFQLLVQQGHNGFAGIDPSNYHLWAMEMAREIKQGGGRHFSIGWEILDPGYAYLCSHLYVIFGDNTLVPRFFNCAISSVGALYLHRIANHFFGSATARLCVLIYLFLPFSLLIALDQRKDPAITFLAVGILWHTIRLTHFKVGRFASGSIVLCFVFLMYYMRSSFVWPFFGIAVIAFTVSSRNFLVAAGGIFLSISIFVASQLMMPENERAGLQSSFERFEGKLQASEQIAARQVGLLRFARVTSLATIWKAPLATGLVVILPFPPVLDFRHIPTTITSWANLFVVALLPSLLWGTYLAIRRGAWRRHVLLLLYPLVYITLIGIANPDMARYRETALPALLILAGHGLKSGTPAVVTAPVYSFLGLLAALVYFSRFW